MVETTDLTTIAYYAGVASIMMSIPLICILDIKYREVPNFIWVYLGIINIPCIAVLYLTGLPYTYIALSIGLVGLYCLMWSREWIGGADAKFLSIIAISTPLLQFTFYLWLMIILGILPFVVYVRNKWFDKDLLKPMMTLKSMFTYYPRGIPYTVPISIAFVISSLAGSW